MAVTHGEKVSRAEIEIALGKGPLGVQWLGEPP